MWNDNILISVISGVDRKKEGVTVLMSRMVVGGGEDSTNMDCDELLLLPIDLKASSKQDASM